MADRDFTERELRRLSRDGDGPGLLKRFRLRGRRELTYLVAPSAAIFDRLFRRKTIPSDLIPIGLTVSSLGSAVGNFLLNVESILLIVPATATFAAWLSALTFWLVNGDDEESPVHFFVRNELKEIEREL